MCGRFDRHSELGVFADLVEGLTLEGAPDLPSSYNVAPSRDVAAIVVDDRGGRRFRALNWGLVPAWSNKPELRRPINARAETVMEKPMFRGAFASGRCLVPCDGYYEWATTAAGKQPYYFRAPGGAPLLIAAICERNTRLAPYPLQTFCLLTREASDAVRGIHHRMPVLFRGDGAECWLAHDTPADELGRLLEEESLEELVFHPVATIVNSPANDSPECIAPVLPA